MQNKTAFVVLAALALVGSAPPVSAQSVGVDGSLNLSYPFSLPAARGKYQPSLELDYNNNLGSTNYGVGWTLTSNYIDGQTRTRANNDSTPRTRYLLSMNGGSKLLVAGPNSTYRLDLSSSYFSLTRSGNTWTGVDAVGNTFSYGCVAATTCSRWYLLSVKDVDNNMTYFDYGSGATLGAAETHTCPSTMSTTALLQRIRYNFATDHSTPVSTVDLQYEPTSRGEAQSINGCLVVHDQRLHSVTVSRTPSSSLTSKVALGTWTLHYADLASSDTHRDLLVTISTTDRNGHTFGLAATFAYETDFDPTTVPAFDAPADFTFTGGDSFGQLPSTECWSWTLGDGSTCDVSQAAVFMDMDGDGLPDIVYGGQDALPGTVQGLHWARNLGSPSGHPTFASMAVIPGSETWSGFLTALNSDGTLLSASDSANYYKRYGIAKNNGGPWVAMGPLQPAPATGPNCGGTNQPACPQPPLGNGALGMVADFNGDGMPDLITSGCPATGTTPANPGGLSILFAQNTSGSLRYASTPVCVDATAAWQKMKDLHQVTQGLPLSYTEPGPRLFTGSGQTTNTWIQLADFDGDGVLDFIVAAQAPASDPSNHFIPATPTWYVFRGFSPGPNAWAFAATPLTVRPAYPWPQNASMSPDIYPIRSVMGPMSGAVYDAHQPPYDPSQMLGGKTIIDFVDLNGDGLPDRVVAFQWAEGTTTHNSWFVDYNTGTGFVQLPGPGNVLGLFQKDLPYQDAWVTTHDSSLFDVNRDGHADLVIRTGGEVNSGAPCGTGANLGGDFIKIWFDSASGLNGSTNFVEAPCLTNPTGHRWRPFDTYNDLDDLSTAKMYNEGFSDLDGDGVYDFYRAPSASEGMPINHWYFYRGHSQKRRPDLLVSMTTPSGLTETFHWTSSTTYGGAVCGFPMVSDVIASIDTSGPAMSPLTVSYSYAQPAIAAVWDDPTQTETQSLGFTVHYETPSVGGLVTQTTYGSTRDTQGMVLSTKRGTAAPPWTSSTPVIENAVAVWSTSTIGSNVVAGTTYSYPAYLYPSSQSRFRTEMGTGPIASQTAQPPDAYGNIFSITITPDAVPTPPSTTATSLTVTRVFASPGSACPSCVVEETVTSNAASGDVAHSYFHYDVPVTCPDLTQCSPRGANVVANGHLSFVESLVSGSGLTGTYESPSTAYYSSSGNVVANVKRYSSTMSVTESITYDAFDDLSVTSRKLDDQSTTLTTTFTLTPYGDVASAVGPVLGGSVLGGASPPPATAVYRLYDSIGRVVADSDQPFTGTAVTNPLRAYEYVFPSLTSPAAVKTYVFASSPAPYEASAAVPPTDDSTQVITYFDPIGRSIQERVRLGSGHAPTSSSGNVIADLSAQYSVRSNVLLDGLGRVTASLEPYFSSVSDYVDPRSSAELSTTGLHATVSAYDVESRPTCSVYEPVSGAIAAAPADAASCASVFTEGSSYRRATRMTYGVDSSLGRAYLTADTVQAWANPGSAPSRIYLDAAGRVVYTHTPSGTSEATSYDVAGRRTALLRYPGAPGTTPVVTNSWTYDKRGRVLVAFADASKYRAYTYLPTGEVVQVIQSANSQPSVADTLAVVSTFKIGTLGRVIERDDSRYETASDCSSSTPHVDSTTFQYDVPHGGLSGRYGPTAGHLTAAFTGNTTDPITTVAIGYDNHGNAVVRDEWYGSSPAVHSVVDSLGPDGRLLTRTMTSSFLTGYNAAGKFGYNVAYDSAGDPVQMSSAYDSTGASTPVGSPGAAIYWTAGTGGTPSATGAYDALGRLAAERWDGTAVQKSRSFLPGSNLPSGYATTLSSGTNVYTVSGMTWQGSLLKAYSLASNWEGGGTSYSATYDLDAHLQQWSAAPQGAAGGAQQKFSESYGFSLENLKTVNVTNSLGFGVASTYNYADVNSPERVTSISVPNAVSTDTFVYDRRNRGLVVQHKLNASQAVPQDSYEYDGQNRLISIAHLGTKLEMLDYDGVGDLSSRTFPAGSPDLARYYVGDDLTLVDRGGAGNVGYAHIRLGGLRIASVYAKSGTQPTVIYYHRDRRNDVVATTTQGGATGLSYRYLPSGAIDKVIGPTGSAANETDTTGSELGFIGALKLSGGLVHLKARTYSPSLRRFLQPDTVDFKRYSYANGDPLNFRDPSGRVGTPDSDHQRETAENNIRNWGGSVIYLNPDAGYDYDQSVAAGVIFGAHLHTQTWTDSAGSHSKQWYEDGQNNASLGISDWIVAAMANDGIGRANYRIATRGLTTGIGRTTTRLAERARGFSVVGQKVSEMLERPVRNFNPTKTNPAVDTMMEGVGTAGALGLSVGLYSAASTVATSADPYGAAASESGAFAGGLMGGEIAAGAAAFAVAGVLTGGAAVAVVAAAAIAGSFFGSEIGRGGADAAYQQWGK